MKLERVEHIDFVVRDIARSVEFYKKLGLVVQRELDEGRTVFLWNEDQQSPVVVELHQAGKGWLASRPPGLNHIAFHVDDVGVAYKELSEAGVAFSLEPQWGSRSGKTVANAEDPDDMPLQFAREEAQEEAARRGARVIVFPD